MPKLLDVKFSLQGQLREDKDTNCFVSYCPALDLYSAGITRLDAKRALRGAVDMYVRLCYSRGILGRLLQEKGFQAALAGVTAPNPTDSNDFIAITETQHGMVYDDVFPVEVPLHLVANQQLNVGEACLQ